MSQKLPVKGFKWVKQKKLSKFNEDFIKKYDEDSDTGYFLEVDIDYPKQLFSFHKDLPYLPERKKVEKVKKLICSICYSYKSFKANIKSWFKTKKSTQSN